MEIELASIMDAFKKIDSLLEKSDNINGKTVKQRWRFNHLSLVRVIGQIEFLIERSQGYHQLLIGDLLTPRSLFLSLLNDLENHERPEHKRFIASLESFLSLSEKLQLNHELINHDFKTLYEELTMLHGGFYKNGSQVDTKKETKKRVVDLLSSYSIRLGELFSYKFELFIYLVLFDYYFWIQNNSIPNLIACTPEISGIYTPFDYFGKNYNYQLIIKIVNELTLKIDIIKRKKAQQ